MGWDGRGKEEFCSIDNGYDRIGIMGDDEDDTYTSMLSHIFLEDVFTGSTKKIIYRYDYEDDWEHVVEAEKRFVFQKSMVPCCIDGVNASPPEDIGGPDEYRKFCRAMAKTTHRSHSQVVLKYGGVFDPSKFDPELIYFE